MTEEAKKAENEREAYKQTAYAFCCMSFKYDQREKCAWRTEDEEEDCEFAGFPCREVREAVEKRFENEMRRSGATPPA